jgi:hypothetical protein
MFDKIERIRLYDRGLADSINGKVLETGRDPELVDRATRLVSRLSDMKE